MNRLPTRPLTEEAPAITFTEEDRLIWREIEWYSIGTDGMYAYRAAGRRDASVMYLAQTSNGNHVYTDGNNRWGVGGGSAPDYDPQENWVRVRLRVQL
jgi:hypothetical protein